MCTKLGYGKLLICLMKVFCCGFVSDTQPEAEFARICLTPFTHSSILICIILDDTSSPAVPTH